MGFTFCLLDVPMEKKKVSKDVPRNSFLCCSNGKYLDLNMTSIEGANDKSEKKISNVKYLNLNSIVKSLKYLAKS